MNTRHSFPGVTFVAAAFLFAACDGSSVLDLTATRPGPTGAAAGEEGPSAGIDIDGDGTIDIGPATPGSAPLRRITYEQLENTVQSLLGLSVSTSGLPKEYVDNGYTNQAIAQATDRLLVDAYSELAKAVADQWYGSTAARNRLVSCTPSGANDASCMRTFVSAFGRLAFRRPLSSEQLEHYTQAALAAAAKANDFWAGARLVIEGLLQSPSFLYRVEQASPSVARADLLKLDGYSIASRLSFLLINAAPDDALLTLAEQGGLETREQVRAASEALLRDPRARKATQRFYDEWLLVTDLPSVKKDPATFPTFTGTLASAMVEETRRLIEDVVWSRNADLFGIFDADYTFVNAELAKLYGLQPPGSGFARVQLPATRRGVIGHGSVLANGHRTDGTSPTFRGLFVRKRMLCQTVPEPPPDVDTTLEPSGGQAVTTRQLYSQHATNAACSGCHKLMDNIGFGLESFDGVGAFRTTENGAPVDDSGVLVNGNTETPFRGVAELGAVLMQTPTTGDCFVRHALQWALGRGFESADENTVLGLGVALEKNERRFQSLLVELASHDAFRFRSN